MENQTGLQIEISAPLSVLEQNIFILWVGICIEIVNTKFCGPRWKIMVSATLKSWVQKNSFFSEKKETFQLCRDHNFSYRVTKFCVHNAKTYLTTAKKVLLYHTQGCGNSSLKSEMKVLNWWEKRIVRKTEKNIYLRKNHRFNIFGISFQRFCHRLVLGHLPLVFENQ